MTRISPSILSADFLNLGSVIGMINRSQAEMIHIDVMDGMFVPNISFGFPVIKAVSAIAEKLLDVHLMIEDPGRYVNQTRDSGAWMMNFHYEAERHHHRVVQAIHQAGMKAGITLNPATPVVMLEDIITELDMVLVMSVNPGYGGQKFIPGALRKVQELRRMIDASGSKTLIQIDGGINEHTGRQAVDAGADVLVAGNSVFSAADPEAMISRLAAL